MNKLTTALSGAIALAFAPACIAPVSGMPWDFARGNRPLPLPVNETQVRTHLTASEGASTSGSPYVDFQYGVRSDLTLGVSVGESLKRISDASQLIGQEVASVHANYLLTSGEGQPSTSAQLKILFKEDSDVEYLPSAAIQLDSLAARAGVSLQDHIDPQPFFELAHWRPLGEYALGLIELDAAFAEIDEIYISPAVVTQLRELVQLQLSFPIGLTSESSDWQALAGFVFRF